MSDPWLVVSFLAAAGLSLGTSWVLVSRLERVGARLGLSEGLLGMLAALSADAPEITAATTALAGHHARVGAGVIIGSNVFNLAALLGLSSVIAGRIVLHRRVVVLEGVVALSIAFICVATVAGSLSPGLALVLVLAVLIPYLLLLGVRHDRLGRLELPARWVRGLTRAVVEEEIELEVAIHPQPGRARDALVASAAVLIVVGASVAMEQAASTLGSRHHVAEIVTGGLILAGVTSLPNAVAAVYLARRGRGPATLSTAMNSNALNVAVGLLIPGTIVGLGGSSRAATFVAIWYFGLTAFVLACAYAGRGLRRSEGVVIVAAYLAFAALTIVGGYSTTLGLVLGVAVPLGVAATHAIASSRAER